MPQRSREQLQEAMPTPLRRARRLPARWSPTSPAGRRPRPGAAAGPWVGRLDQHKQAARQEIRHSRSGDRAPAGPAARHGNDHGIRRARGTLARGHNRYAARRDGALLAAFEQRPS